MAEILIHKIGRGDDADPGDWQPGDVVDIRRDGFTWGKREVGPLNTTFLLVKLPGLAPSNIKQLVKQSIPGAPFRKQLVTLDLASAPSAITNNFGTTPESLRNAVLKEIEISARPQQLNFVDVLVEKT